ncbi:OLC1v1024416C3 [Oldenlandia corymbosa var. corymbosa]|uniref:OLC1v1024416C3 n=1 Tax=Oldenlandia corymbosa var. corymbosa TaxID=529605 RepID=A0AAV1C374_OLDCO|nr:OLC1v1024416C3 [Oldenlandia corymbosa var. corymbosa]
MEHDYDHNKPLVSKKGCNSENFGNVVPNIPTSDDEGDDDGEIGEINNVGDFFREFGKESRKLWYLAAPSILTSVFQYAFGALTQIFSGHLSTGELAAISMETSVISSLGYGLLMGMGSAVETLCGQAYGAKHVDKLGIYLQKSWIILNTAAIGIVFYFLLTTPLLNLLGQDPELSAQAGKFAVMMIPQQFAYAFAIPLAKFLQAQSKVFEMAGIAGIAVCFHALVGWIFMMKLRWGLFGAALALNSSWWLVAIGQFLYVVCGFCGRAWSGFSWKAFSNLSEFVKLSISSAIMFCLEIWYLMALTLVAGYLPNPEISVAALSITYTKYKRLECYGGFGIQCSCKGWQLEQGGKILWPISMRLATSFWVSLRALYWASSLLWASRAFGMDCFWGYSFRRQHYL